MSWGEMKKAVNSTVGTDSMSPLDKIIEKIVKEHINSSYNTNSGEPLDKMIERILVRDANAVIPDKVSTENLMLALLRTAPVGSIFEYTGDGDLYTNGAYYLVEVGTIDFTIDGNKYQAEEGMTWQEWIESDYNYDDRTYIFGGQVCYLSSTSGEKDGTYVVFEKSPSLKNMLPEYKITPNREYFGIAG